MLVSIFTVLFEPTECMACIIMHSPYDDPFEYSDYTANIDLSPIPEIDMGHEGIGEEEKEEKEEEEEMFQGSGAYEPEDTHEEHQPDLSDDEYTTSQRSLDEASDSEPPLDRRQILFGECGLLPHFNARLLYCFYYGVQCDSNSRVCRNLDHGARCQCEFRPLIHNFRPVGPKAAGRRRRQRAKGPAADRPAQKQRTEGVISKHGDGGKDSETS